VDRGVSWADVLPLGQYRMLTPHSIAELDGTAYLLEYQAFTQDSVPIRLWASVDGGASWTVRYTFAGHRHGHGLAADPIRHELWAFFGDGIPRCGIFRSSDEGRSWVLRVPGAPGCAVDATVLPGGSLLFGEDIVYQPELPHVSSVTAAGVLTRWALLPGPSYSTYAIPGGGYLVGAAWTANGDVSPPGELDTHVFGSWDGRVWEDLLRYRRLPPTEEARADVYWRLPSGELILDLSGVQGMGQYGKGYQILRVLRR
jgi:hypothetical protein